MMLVGTATSVFARPTVLTLKESIQDSTIIYPESFETDTQKLMENWYLKNYAVLDESSEAADDVPTTKEEFIERLQNLPTVIEMPYNQVVRSYIDMYTQRRRALVEEMLGLSIYYMPIFEQALEREGLPLELKYLPVIESALNPDAVSRAGATGLWQFMLSTAKGLGLDVNSLVDERRDPIKSSYAAAQYLRDLYKVFGDWTLVIAAYNCGPEQVNKAIRRSGGERDYWKIYPYLPKETRGYVPAFIAANYIMTYYCDHNICPMTTRLPAKTDTLMLSRNVHLEQIAAVCGIGIDELRALNPAYRRDIIPGATELSCLRLPQTEVGKFIDNEDSIYNYKADVLLSRRATVEVNKAAASSASKTRSTARRSRSRARYITIRSGQTLSHIAKRYGTTVSRLKRLNGLKGTSIRAGKRLRVR